MDRQTAIEKIRKCLALAKSSNPNEAAAAMRQAQKLMQQFGVENLELWAAGVTEEWEKSSASKKPARYEAALAGAVASAFSCEIIFKRRLSQRLEIEGGYSFIGVAPSPEIASYAFKVLLRQLQRSRFTYIKTVLRRHTKNKTAAADQFCEGWVVAVRNLIASMVPTAEQKQAIDAYMQIHYGDTTSLEPRERQSGGRGGLNHRINGYQDGKTATLNNGVGSAPSIPRLE